MESYLELHAELEKRRAAAATTLPYVGPRVLIAG